MAKIIKWSKLALTDRLKILDFWYKKTGSKNYPHKLDRAFRTSLKLIIKFPDIGRTVEGREEKYFVIEGYQIFYQVTENEIDILRIWDSRQDPDRLKIL